MPNDLIAYFHGLQNGKTITYHSDGKIKEEGEYILGLPVGLWKKWNEQGLLVEEKFFPTPTLDEVMIHYLKNKKVTKS
ncbi:MAG: hypothetical protein BroJett040_06090 [Oligoflexia bacterium]|nr:MAG: hypothetical protein BroJett040_06090 [Oligoflexia bacterium]